MEITTRRLTDADKARCLEIEAGATPNLHYLEDVWELFTKRTQGDLTGAFFDGQLVGLGKLTVLLPGYGWLETLRVDPAFQNRGAGKAIYRRYLQEMQELGLKSVGMYTGVTNARSAGLAEKHGLSLRGRYAGFNLPQGKHPVAAENLNFRPVPEGRAEEVLSPLLGECGDHLVLNRTFYPVVPGIAQAMAREGWLFEEAESGSVIVVGGRFQPEKALHVALMGGELDRCLAFAQQRAAQAGSAGLQAMRPYDDKNLCAALVLLGFEPENKDCITLWN